MCANPKMKNTRKETAAKADGRSEPRVVRPSRADVPRATRRGRPRNNPAEDVATKHRILDAALKTFSIHGYEGASIADIARLHNVSPALIHYYFSTKEDLWHEALDHGIGDVLANLKETIADLPELDCVGRLKFFIRRYIAMAAERPEVFRVIIRESETRGPRLRWLSHRWLIPLYGLFTDLVEKAQNDGRLMADIAPYHLSQIIAGASYQYIASRNRMLETYGIDVCDKAQRERHANAVIDVLFNGMLRD